MQLLSEVSGKLKRINAEIAQLDRALSANNIDSFQAELMMKSATKLRSQLESEFEAASRRAGVDVCISEAFL